MPCQNTWQPIRSGINSDGVCKTQRQIFNPDFSLMNQLRVCRLLYLTVKDACLHFKKFGGVKSFIKSCKQKNIWIGTHKILLLSFCRLINSCIISSLFKMLLWVLFLREFIINDSPRLFWINEIPKNKSYFLFIHSGMRTMKN